MQLDTRCIFLCIASSWYKWYINSRWNLTKECMKVIIEIRWNRKFDLRCSDAFGRDPIMRSGQSLIHIKTTLNGYVWFINRCHWHFWYEDKILLMIVECYVEFTNMFESVDDSFEVIRLVVMNNDLFIS